MRASAAGAVSAERRPKEPKLPGGFDDDDDDFEDNDECCDENPPLNDAPDGLASTGADASDSARDSANTTCAYVEMVFSMVRSAVES